MKVEVKICGITRRDDAELAVSCGANFVGLVLAEQSPRRLSLGQLAEFADLPVRKVGVFVDADLNYIRQAVEIGHLDVVQLHGQESGDFARRIDFAEVWKATYDPAFPAARLVCDAPVGGSGTFGDHRKAAELAKVRKVMLAGGLTPDNVAELVVQVRPVGIDLSSGVESSAGVKDHEKLRKLFQQVKGIKI